MGHQRADVLSPAAPAPTRSTGQLRRATALLVVCVLAAVPRAFARDNPPPQPGVLAAAATLFTLGPLQIEVHVRSGGTVLDCLVRLSTIPVAAHTLNPELPNYAFDAVAGNTTAKGAFKTIFMPAGQLSTLEADLAMTIDGQTQQPYRGMIYYWMVDAGGGTPRPAPPKPPVH